MTTHSFPALGFDPAPGDPDEVEGVGRHCARAARAMEQDAARRVDIVELPTGGGVKVATSELVVLPTGEAAPAWVTQYLVPVFDTGWLAVITTTTGNADLAAAVEEVGDGMAASLRFEERDPAGDSAGSGRA